MKAEPCKVRKEREACCGCDCCCAVCRDSTTPLSQQTDREISSYRFSAVVMTTFGWFYLICFFWFLRVLYLIIKKNTNLRPILIAQGFSYVIVFFALFVGLGIFGLVKVLNAEREQKMRSNMKGGGALSGGFNQGGRGGSGFNQRRGGRGFQQQQSQQQPQQQQHQQETSYNAMSSCSMTIASITQPHDCILGEASSTLITPSYNNNLNYQATTTTATAAPPPPHPPMMYNLPLREQQLLLLQQQQQQQQPQLQHLQQPQLLQQQPQLLNKYEGKSEAKSVIRHGNILLYKYK